MKISIVTGFQWHAVELGSALENLGHRVNYISTLDICSKGQRVPLKFLLSISERIQILKLIFNPLFSAFALKKIQDSDLVIVWSSYGFFLSSKKIRVPVVVVRGNHHIDSQFRLMGIQDGTNLRVSRFLEKWDYHIATKITVPTIAIAEDPCWGSYSEKLIVSPYGFTPANKEIERSISNPVKIIFAGALSHRKGFDRVAEIFCNPIAGIEFTVIGRKESHGQQIPKWWKYLGEVSHTKSLEQIAMSDILILLSREEGMARVGQEALSSGIPIICTPETGLSTWTLQGAGIVTKSNPNRDEVLSAISTIVRNFTIFSNSAYLVAKSWTWKDHAQKILDEL